MSVLKKKKKNYHTETTNGFGLNEQMGENGVRKKKGPR